MDSLTKSLIKDFLPESIGGKEVTALFGGGFKPPTAGHLSAIQKALENHPEIDNIIIYVGGKVRDGITQEQSFKIWDEYYKPLIDKPVRIENSPSPIGDIYRYAKNNPEDTLYWIIGAREGREDDLQDITSRSVSLDKYPNLNLRTIITQGGVSGTAARNASKISLDKFKPFVPTELSDEEVEQVYNIVADKITEGRKKKKDPKKGTGKKPEGSKRRLYTDEDPKDTIGIKFSTRQDIVDTLNKTSFKAKSHARQSQIINLIHQRVRAAYSRAKDPKVKKRLKTGLDYITKKKEASKKKTQRLKKLNENASYTSNIDIIKMIDDFTRYMIYNGMNISPLPTLELRDGDRENAKNFFGKTAYYDPNEQHIVIYTEGRHPKDIVRSYAHEMIHHIQSLEDRLGDIPGTDTTSSEHLTKLEKEANLRGTMTFRNWTDSILNESIVGDKIKCDKCGWSWNIVDGGNDLFTCHKCMNINEGKKKDPFGLMAYARELGQLNEEESEYKVYLDMDGVLADFDQRFRDISGMEPRDFENKYGRKEFWNLIDEENKIKFWVGIPVMDGAAALVNAVKDYDYELLTSPSAKKQSYLGKILWVKNHTGSVFPSKPRINFKRAKEKHEVKPQLSQTDILIDDREDTIGRWNAAGGTGIVYKSIGQVLSDLKKLGL